MLKSFGAPNFWHQKILRTSDWLEISKDPESSKIPQIPCERCLDPLKTEPQEVFVGPNTYSQGIWKTRGCSRGGGNWGTLRIPREDWGTLGNIREHS